MSSTICANCGKATDEILLTVDGKENICWECATEMALEAQIEDREIEILDENGDEWRLCQWCSELFPESELRKEVDLGHLCDRCIAAI